MIKEKSDLIIFLIVTTLIILLLLTFVVTLIYLYQKRQIAYQDKMTKLKIHYENNIMSAQLEVQENTFQHVSREIHDNISLSLTLAKLNLNTFDWLNKEKANLQIHSSIDLLSRAITGLNHISRSLNSDDIEGQGLIRALETEIERIRVTGLFHLHFNITGEPVYLESQKDLIIFRIAQEALNNVIKHAQASYVSLTLHFSPKLLSMTIADNGKGFATTGNLLKHGERKGAGLKNMEARATMIGGTMEIISMQDTGTSLIFKIPI